MATVVSGIPAQRELVADAQLELVVDGAVGANPAVWRDYLTLTKPRVMSLLVLTALCAMTAAAAGDPSVTGLLALTVGGCFACGGASAFNHVLDRDIDRMMGARTANRPVAAGRIRPRDAVIFAVTLCLLSFALMWTLDNLLAAALATAGGTFYVVVYTLGLKRRTSANIVIGGAAGAFPALSGWAAAHGSLGVGAWYLFAIVVVWTPPHFWSLAMLLRQQYADADIPMLPVVKGERHTALQILVYSLGLAALTLVPGVTGVFGASYLVGAVLLGAVFCGFAWRLWREPSRARAAYLFHFSLLYLALLFAAVAVDAVVR
ncbi:MAG TPA: heme o synthase [Solirubrobacteraceae bacterium]|nr:heme o synthase [Solirubrobacteraceae bacterium]